MRRIRKTDGFAALAGDVVREEVSDLVGMGFEAWMRLSRWVEKSSGPSNRRTYKCCPGMVARGITGRRRVTIVRKWRTRHGDSDDDSHDFGRALGDEIDPAVAHHPLDRHGGLEVMAPGEDFDQTGFELPPAPLEDPTQSELFGQSDGVSETCNRRR